MVCLAPIDPRGRLKAGPFNAEEHMIDPKAITAKMLALMPSSLEPGDPPIDFSEIVSRIRSLDRQSLFLSLDEWLEANEIWLQDTTLGLSLEDGDVLSWDQDLLIGGSPAHEKQINAIEELVARLEYHMVPENNALIEKLVFLFSSEIDLAMNPREALSGVAADYNVVEDAENWLMRHRTTRQADQLSADTKNASPPAPRPRI